MPTFARRGTVSTGSPTHRHRQTDNIGNIKDSFVNKVPLSRICELCDVSRKQIYGKIDFPYRQIFALTHDREVRLATAQRAGRSSSPRTLGHT